MKKPVVVNIRQDGLWATSALITLNGVKYGRGLEKAQWLRHLRIDATHGVAIDVCGGPFGTYWEQFLGKTRHSIQIDGAEVAHVESRGILGLQSWLVIGHDSFRLSHEFYGHDPRLIRKVTPTRWNSQRPCDFEFAEDVAIPIAAIVSYWLWCIYVNSTVN